MTKEEAAKVYHIIQIAQNEAMLSVTGEGLDGYASLAFMGEALHKEARAKYKLWTQQLESLAGLTIDEMEEAETEL